MAMLCLNDFEEYAKEYLDRKTWAFYSQGAEREFLLKENVQAYTRYTIIPRLLINASPRDLSTTVLGHKLSLPVALAPTAYQRLAHHEGEIGAATACEEIGTIYTLSTVASTSLEDVARSIPNRKSPLWMQIYMAKHREDSKELIQRAEANGYKAIVLTIDTPVIGLQLQMLRNGGLQLPPHIGIPNALNAIKRYFKTDKSPNHLHLVRELFQLDITWDDVKWVKSITNLPIVLKGIITADDAKKAVEYGASAVWVSNHGGRQLDCIDTSIDVLPEIASALAGSGCEIYVDGGVRWGTDVLKALALGANAVFIGRPLLWGLTYSGKDGVLSVLNILKAELDRAMHLSGCQNIKDIGPHLIKKRHFSKF